MQRSKAEKLKLAWGNEPCHHPQIAKESNGKILTGFVICTQCGRPIYQAKKHNVDIKRGNNSQSSDQESNFH